METNDISFGTLMDEFVAKYITEDEKRLAMIDLQLIVIKAQRASMAEVAKIYQPS